MDDFKNFLTKYWGAILGGIIATILLCTGAYRLLVVIVILGLGIWAGNYYQNNKETIKSKLKKIIDKM